MVILVDLLTAMPGMKKSIGGVGAGFGEQNDEGGRLFDFAVSHDLVVAYTLFKIRNSYLIIYASGGLIPGRLHPVP